MELEITWNRVVRVWWSYLWRNLIATLIALGIGMVLGFIIGFVLGMLGFPVRLIQLLTAPLGVLIGLAISVVPMKLILGKDFGEFRLVLLGKQVQQLPSCAPQPVITDQAA